MSLPGDELNRQEQQTRLWFLFGMLMMRVSIQFP